MKILVTGGAGFIGTHLIKELSKKHNIVVFDNYVSYVHGKNLENTVSVTGVKYINFDIANSLLWHNYKSEWQDVDVIYHLAAETGTSHSMSERLLHTNTNINGTAVLLDSLSKTKNNVKKIILASSRAVYGNGACEETQKTEPASVYGLTKLVQEQLLQISSPVPFTILRFQNVYGPGQSLTNPYTGLISIFYKKLIENQDIEIYDNALCTRDFVYVTDVVNALTLALDSNLTGPFNIGTGKKTKILEVGTLLKQFLNSKSNINITNYHRPGDVIDVESNIMKAEKELGFKASTDVVYGLKEFIRHNKK